MCRHGIPVMFRYDILDSPTGDVFFVISVKNLPLVQKFSGPTVLAPLQRTGRSQRKRLPKNAKPVSSLKVERC